MQTNGHKILNVLVIEDDPGHQRLLELYLKRAGCECDLVADGKEGFQKATSGDYDLGIIDLNIPKIDGFMVATFLRDHDIQIPLVAVTALDLRDIRDKAIAVGYNDFIKKPFDQAQIESILKRFFPVHANNIGTEEN